MFLLRLVKKLRHHKVDFAVAGGYAVSLHGAVRGTMDVDLIVTWRESQLIQVEAALISLGLVSRLPVTAKEIFAFRDEYLSKRNLVAWSFVNPNQPSELVDILLTADLARIETKTVNVQGVAVPITAIDDLIEMKRAAGREQDRADVAALEKLR
jgi:predicted nucleotidyltransferase